jgi:predicted nucleotidyltransferase
MLRIFRSEALVRTIGVLAMHSDEELGLEELSHLVGTTRTNLVYTMKFLEPEGLVAHRSVGKKKLYRIVTDHPLYPELVSIAIKTFGGQEVVSDAIRSDSHVEYAAIFGSFAKGSATPRSDVDVLVVIDDDDADETDYRIAGLLAMAGDRLGRVVHANIVRRADATASQIVQDILTGPLIAIKGKLDD